MEDMFEDLKHPEHRRYTDNKMSVFQKKRFKGVRGKSAIPRRFWYFSRRKVHSYLKILEINVKKVLADPPHILAHGLIPFDEQAAFFRESGTPAGSSAV